MDSFFEIIIDLLSVPLEKWDDLRLRYKLILSVMVLSCIAGIVISLN